MFQAGALLWLLLSVALLLTLAAGAASPRYRQVIGGNLGALTRMLFGLGLFALLLYVTLYFLALVGGFYESLTCKVVTLPACEDPLQLPAWLRLPDQSVGGVIGILPLLGIFLAKSLQGPRAGYSRIGLGRFAGLLGWLLANASIIAIFFVELWLAWLRGAAEAADRQVRLSLGLDADLPLAYLGVAQWGAVVLALGLSAVVVFLGVAARHGLLNAAGGFTGLRHGAGLISLGGALLSILASGTRDIWTIVAISLGRFTLKLQSALKLLYATAVVALGRAALKAQSLLARLWAFFAILLGRIPALLVRWARRRRSGGAILFLGAAIPLITLQAAQAATTFVILQDVSGGEAGRLPAANQLILNWADPSPQLSLLERGDRLIVIPIRAPGHLDPVYSTIFNATYAGSQLDRYAFYAELRNVLPTEVDDAWGTAVSEALRSAAFYLREAPPEDDKVLIIFGNGEDHSENPIAPEELTSLAGAAVIRLNAGIDTFDYWNGIYRAAGAQAQLVYDEAATRLLRNEELYRALERALGTPE